jgi:hypothetical protein
MMWEFFDLTRDNKFVTCRTCEKQYKYFENTTNLKQHLKRMHPSYLFVLPKKIWKAKMNLLPHNLQLLVVRFHQL